MTSGSSIILFSSIWVIQILFFPNTFSYSNGGTFSQINQRIYNIYFNMERTQDRTYINLSRLLTMCFLTFLILSINESCRNIFFNISDLNADKGLGVIMLLINFLWGPIGMFFVGYLMRRLYFKALFVITSLGTTVFLLGTLILIQCGKSCDSLFYEATVIGLSLISSPFQSVYYCLLNYYIDYCSPPEAKGVYFGMSYSIFSMSSLMSAAILYFVKPHSSNINLSYGIMVVIALVVSGCFWLLKEPVKIQPKETILEKIAKERDELITSTKSLKYQELEISEPPTLRESATDMMKIMNLPSMKYLLWSIALMATVSSFILFGLSHLIRIVSRSDKSDYQKMLYSNLLIYGFGQFFGGISSGIVSDLYSRFLTLLWVQGVLILSITFAIFSIFLQQLIFLNIFCFLVGICVSALEATVYALFGQDYSNEPYLYAFLNFIYCMAYTVATIVFGLSLFEYIPESSSFIYLVISCFVNLGFMIAYMIKSNKAQSEILYEKELSQRTRQIRLN